MDDFYTYNSNASEESFMAHRTETPGLLEMINALGTVMDSLRVYGREGAARYRDATERFTMMQELYDGIAAELNARGITQADNGEWL